MYNYLINEVKKRNSYIKDVEKEGEMEQIRLFI